MVTLNVSVELGWELFRRPVYRRLSPKTVSRSTFSDAVPLLLFLFLPQSCNKNRIKFKPILKGGKVKVRERGGLVLESLVEIIGRILPICWSTLPYDTLALSWSNNLSMKQHRRCNTVFVIALHSVACDSSHEHSKKWTSNSNYEFILATILCANWAHAIFKLAWI